MNETKFTKVFAVASLVVCGLGNMASAKALQAPFDKASVTLQASEAYQREEEGSKFDEPGTLVFPGDSFMPQILDRSRPQHTGGLLKPGGSNRHTFGDKVVGRNR